MVLVCFFVSTLVILLGPFFVFWTSIKRRPIFSIIFPLTKIVLLLELSLLELFEKKQKAFTLRLMETLGKWSMMDVMLLAFLVMLVKLGDMVEFQFGPAIIAFVLCVAMSMVASLTFDPHAIWEKSIE